MPQMTTSQARVIDPILTAVARAAAMQAAPVADALFPIVTVGQRAGKIISFNADSFKLYNTARAPGANTKRVQFGYASGNFALVDYSLEGSVPIEIMQEAAAVPGIDLASSAIRTVRQLQQLEREYQCAVLATTAGNYPVANRVTLAGADQWSDPASDPFGDISAAREVVRGQTGVRPNKLVLGPKPYMALSNHPDVLARLRGGAGADSTDRAPATAAEMARVFDLEQVIEGGSIYHNGTAFVDVWGTYAVLAYTIPKSMAEMGSPSYGYTYQLDGHPFAEEAYFERNPKTWFYPVTDARQPVIAGSSAGFLFTGASA
jgi:hypothetical protein